MLVATASVSRSGPNMCNCRPTPSIGNAALLEISHHCVGRVGLPIHSFALGLVDMTYPAKRKLCHLVFNLLISYYLSGTAGRNGCKGHRSHFGFDFPQWNLPTPTIRECISL